MVMNLKCSQIEGLMEYLSAIVKAIIAFAIMVGIYKLWIICAAFYLDMNVATVCTTILC